LRGEKPRRWRGDRVIILAGWLILILGALIGNLLTDQDVNLIGFNISLLGPAIFSFILPRLFNRIEGRRLPIFLVFLVHAAFVTLLCYFSGGARSDVRLLYLIPIVLSMRFGVNVAVTVALMSIISYSIMGFRYNISLRFLALNDLLFLLAVPVVAPITSRRVSELAYQAARAARDIRHELERLSALNDISAALLDHLRSPGMPEDALEGIAGLFNADACWIYGYNEGESEERKLKHIASYNVEEDYLRDYRYISPDLGVTGRAVVTKQIEAVQSPSDQILSRIKRFPFAHPTRMFASRIAVPLIAREKTVGVLTIATYAPRNWDEREINLLQAIANQIAIAIDNALLYEQQRRELEERLTLHNILETLGATDRVDELVEFTYAELKKLMPIESFVLLKSNEALNILEPIAQLGYSTDEEIDDILGCWAIKRSRQFVVNDSRNDFTCRYSKGDLRSYVCVPLIAGGRRLGAIKVGNNRPNFFTENHIKLLVEISRQLAVAIQRAELLEELRRLAIKDPLTDVYNRGYFERQLQMEIARSNRSGHPVSLIYLDLDDFKQVNDRFGHNIGDNLLKQIARLFASNIRSTDILARIGGEEFAVILPETSKSGALTLAEKLRLLVERTKFMGDSQSLTIQETVSAGIATYPDDALSADDLLRKADDAMYSAKELGKNRVEIWRSNEDDMDITSSKLSHRSDSVRPDHREGLEKG
jgi:diguanylate cyclase (GGDEF)-like protein